ncbi:MAG: sigma-70 family RNA polymerase sigma factor [Defluviitaleaceae bacterium]|nr:sigma-70 family RNA polymerase sigma factor [Defluviitaleaceae bacterium]
MTQVQAEQTVLRLMNQVYNFARSRTATTQDAEDIAQEIVMKLYRALLTRQDIAKPEQFAWTIAHNTLANYYRNRFGYKENVPIHGLVDVLPAADDVSAQLEQHETITRLHSEIAYLSKIQHRIVIMYYFEGKPQQEIANALCLPLGTVKWHLSNAKSDLKKGMNFMRTSTELKFNPIKFNMISTNGSAGTMGGNTTYLRSTLAQNILYLVREEALTVNEIAGALAVSPVYVEGEIEFLEENGFMLRHKKGYISNILLDIPTTKSNRQKCEMYDKAAGLFAPALFDALMSHIKLGDDGVICPRNDMNFVLWALVPYVTAWSGKPDEHTSFEEAATIRPDGGVNICYCTIHNHEALPIKHSASMAKMGGPSWNGGNGFMLWMMDTIWGGDRVGNYHPDIMNRDLSALRMLFDGHLASDDEAVRMIERGFISQKPGPKHSRPTDTLSIVWLNSAANKRLIAIANSIRDKYHAQLVAMKTSYVESQLAATPEHLKKARAYGLQYIFHSDGYFIIYMLHKLIETGKLKLPSEEQRKSLCAVIVAE